jgi:hypothetical protein
MMRYVGEAPSNMYASGGKKTAHACINTQTAGADLSGFSSAPASESPTACQHVRRRWPLSQRPWGGSARLTIATLDSFSFEGDLASAKLT